jgi:hypothetical protein
MHDYIEDMDSQMRKLTNDFNMLKEMRHKDLEVLHRLLPESEKPGKQMQIADEHPQGIRNKLVQKR